MYAGEHRARHFVFSLFFFFFTISSKIVNNRSSKKWGKKGPNHARHRTRLGERFTNIDTKIRVDGPIFRETPEKPSGGYTSSEN